MDGPGIGENGKGSQMESYLAKSFGVIYLVNTASAGGVNSGRVGRYSSTLEILLHCQ